ncbi:hypothetical protein TNCV_1938391 [Trichonephila clavipes]|nr:hypothetical protein TNCV_1938391 [Trichonephila clavipes]
MKKIPTTKQVIFILSPNRLPPSKRGLSSHVTLPLLPFQYRTPEKNLLQQNTALDMAEQLRSNGTDKSVPELVIISGKKLRCVSESANLMYCLIRWKKPELL